MRVSTVPTVFDESVVLRLLEKNFDRLSLEGLHFTPPTLTKLREDFSSILSMSNGACAPAMQGMPCLASARHAWSTLWAIRPCGFWGEITFIICHCAIVAMSAAPCCCTGSPGFPCARNACQHGGRR